VISTAELLERQQELLLEVERLADNKKTGYFKLIEAEIYYGRTLENLLDRMAAAKV